MQDNVVLFSFPQHQWPPLPAAWQRNGEVLARLAVGFYGSTGNQGFCQLREEAVKTLLRQAPTNRAPTWCGGVSSTATTMTVDGGSLRTETCAMKGPFLLPCLALNHKGLFLTGCFSAWH